MKSSFANTDTLNWNTCTVRRISIFLIRTYNYKTFPLERKLYSEQRLSHKQMRVHFSLFFSHLAGSWCKLGVFICRQLSALLLSVNCFILILSVLAPNLLAALKISNNGDKHCILYLYAIDSWRREKGSGYGKNCNQKYTYNTVIDIQRIN